MGRLIWQYQTLYIFLFFLHFEPTWLSSLSSKKISKSCLPKEGFDLLQFKSTFSIDASTSPAPDDFGHPKTDTWEEGTDCCLWDGVTCDELTGHVISLDLSCSWLHGTIPSNTTLFLFSHLQSLNLAYNNFCYSPIPSQFGLFAKLTHLNLSHSGFFGLIPPEISHLSKMVSLDLTVDDDSYLEFKIHCFKKLSQNLTQLRILHLGGVNMSSIAPKSLLNLSSSLRSLHLDDCSMQGKLPDDIFRFPSLQVLHLSANKYVTGNFPKTNWSSPLRSLVLSYMNFSLEVPNSIGHLKSLEYLDLSSNNFHGQLPYSVFNLTQLFSLNLSNNQLVGPLPCSMPGLTNLYHLDLSHNFLNGRIPSWLFTLPSLQNLDLSNNILTGPIDQFQQNNSSLLEKISLRNNVIQGPIPSSVFGLENLIVLNLSFNNFSGNIKWNMLQKLKNLKLLYLSYNVGLSSTASSIANFSMPNLKALYFSSCNISEFPNFLRTLETLEELDLSNNIIHGWILKEDSKGWPSLGFLNLSGNFLTGLEQHPWNNVEILDLRSNLLQGRLLVPSTSLRSYFISNNKLSGNIPSLLCNASSLEILDLSDNALSGVIPECLGNLSNGLSVLDLRNNNFHGSINFATGTNLKYLDLYGNQFKGPLPRSLVNFCNLEILNLGSNNINDTFPYWLETLPKLKILVLRSNNFHGIIGHPKTLSPFPMLRILDLSHNQFTGLLPIKYLQNLKCLVTMEEPQYVLGREGGYYDNGDALYYFNPLFVLFVDVTMKGLEIEMYNIQNSYTNIDFSNNQFYGEIPEAIGILKSLLVLNFSHNNLVGHIPSSLGNMTSLESLDLSSNKLVGAIPWQLTDLTFLEVLNLSNNQLMGPIPQGKQFSTFSNDSYIGNLGLCDFPLSKKCSDFEPPQLLSARFHEEEEDSVGWFDWKIAAMGYGCGLVIGLSMGYIVFATGKPQWFVKMVERKQNRKMRRSNARCRGRRN